MTAAAEVAPPRLSRGALVLRYAAFAVIAIAVNLAMQRAVHAAGGVLPVLAERIGPETYRYAVYVRALGAGTAAGLVVKYVLDKRWIFYDTATGVAAHGKKFGLYTVMGLITTAIFWGTQTTFWMIWDTVFMREVGAILGLTVGYLTKYWLDRRFVFTDSRREAVAPPC